MIYQTQCHASNAYTQTCQQVGHIIMCLSPEADYP